jgi:hypothetical protein
LHPFLIAKNSLAIPANFSTRNPMGTFVSVTGYLNSQEKLGDGLALKEGSYIALKRLAEKYFWTNHNDNTSDNAKKMAWQQSYSEITGKQKNLTNFLKTKVFLVTHANIGIYQLNPNIVKLPEFNKLVLDSNIIDSSHNFIWLDEYMFRGKGFLNLPSLGDERLSYFVVPNGIKVTLFGSLAKNNYIEPYNEQKNKTFYGLYRGDRVTVLSNLQMDYLFWLWVFRLAVSLLMWIGLLIQFRLMCNCLALLPFFVNRFRMAYILISLFLVLLFSTMTILLCSLFQNSLTALVIILTGAIAFEFLLNRKSTSINFIN